MPYRPNEIEPRWQSHWDQHGSYVAREDRSLPKFYALDMFPYPSGKGLHVGHPASYTPGDVVCRYKRARGFNVLHPIGYDAFGLPAEQRAIEEGVAPQVSTEEAIANFRRQLKMLGLSYDWTREVSTASPEYYKWTQWIFTKLVACDRAYLGTSTVNWCEALGTVLANDEVIDGRSERGGHPVEQRQMRQWMIRITAYADALLEGLDGVDWPEATKTMQRERIGRSRGASITFALEGHDASVTVFTTRPDTLWGVTYMVLAPEHALVAQITTDAQRAEVDAYLKRTAGRSELERRSSREKTGVWTGAYARNPGTGELVPVWVADYVLHGYGTGAIRAVPGHDERDWAFAKAMSLPVREVVSGGDVDAAAYAGEGTMVNSGPLTGASTAGGAAVAQAIAWLEAGGHGRGTITYSLRDWAFARQRYWGEPIPALKDEAGDFVRALNEDELPLELPSVDDYRPRGTGSLPRQQPGVGALRRPGHGPRAAPRDRHHARQRGVELVLLALLRPPQLRGAL
ncbi:MAG: leucine--tRNA ligase [Polyangiales bacterium]